MKYDLRSVCGQFCIYGDMLVAVPFGTGHINDTFQVTYDQGGVRLHYILQRVNTAIFTEPEKLMDNFVRVTAHIRAKLAAARGNGPRRCTLELIPARDGRMFTRDAQGNFFRCYAFVENARTYDILENPGLAYQAASAFGHFQADLADLDGRLNETIAFFHHTPKRLEALEAAAKADRCNRLAEVQPELDFIRRRAGECSLLIDLQAKGELVERVTHNDTKLNNVLIDDLSGCGCCVIDLDTVMPGLPHYDFGDMVRTGTSPAAEDETDLSKVGMRFEFFEALLRGYLSGAGSFLNATERELLPFSGKLITLEIGIRFLTDYLDGDRYFKIHRPSHNLDRCRTQLKLVESIEQQFDAMRRLNAEI